VSALRNEGELASPYFLLELWLSREEIDIDPETYASLKRKSRRLVRDARAAELRGQEVDQDWRQLRRETLALAKLQMIKTSSVMDGWLQAWSDEGGRESLLVLELDPNVDPDQREAIPELEESPSTAFELGLDSYEGEAGWGMLLAGLELRLYRRGTGVSQQYLALDLESLVELNDEHLWLAFAGLFRSPAFAAGEDGVPLVRRVVDESRRHASALAADMRADVVTAAESLIQGVLRAPANREILGEPPDRETLQRLFQQTLYYLYRLLFLLYGEARDILPVSGGGPYATTYSVDHLVEIARRLGANAPATTYVGEAIRELFDLMWNAEPDLAKRLGVRPVGGELFDPERTEPLDRCEIPDSAWCRALVALAIGSPGSPRGKLGRRSSFAELGVDQLGSIYEGLLVLEPRYIEDDAALVRIDGERRVVERDIAAEFHLERTLGPGDFVLESASGRRKGSGSFYTPHEITEYLTHAALDPLVEPLVTGGDSAAILQLRVCDPAMGSGAFLVQAARVLGRALARARATGNGAGAITPDQIKRAESEIIRRCLYGVDLNPLAVALAKVSLWLETLQSGEPLTFLDVHLRVGDSLISASMAGEDRGVSVEEIVEWPKGATKGLSRYLKAEAGEDGAAMLGALKGRKALRKVEQWALPGMEGFEVGDALRAIADRREAIVSGAGEGDDLLRLELDAETQFRQLKRDRDSLWNRLRAAADFWCAQWFWPGEADDFAPYETDPRVSVLGPLGEGAFKEAAAYLLDPDRKIRGDVAAALEVAEDVAAERHFFHWELEFPEVLLEREGFDAVIGNPPWNTLSPDVKEFFSTYDPLVFRKGVPKRRQTHRKDELRDDPEIDARWRQEARWLHELSAYAKPDAGRFTWFAKEGNLRKGDANVFRLFVERAYTLLRPGGRYAQVLPDSVYVSSPATEVRRRLVEEGTLERCYVFENRQAIFPIHRSVKVVLLSGEAGSGPTHDFRIAFYIGKGAAGQDRTIGVEEMPATLAELEESAPSLTRKQIKKVSPETWSFPELQTPLDVQIALHCADRCPPLNLDDRGWNLTYCRELDADKHSDLFHEEDDVAATGAKRRGLRWDGPGDEEWWPLVEGTLFYHLEFPQEGKEPNYWVRRSDLRQITGRLNEDGTQTWDHFRVAWRLVSASTNERSAVACVIPPGSACKHSAPTIWGSQLDLAGTASLVGVLSSFCFDYLIRFMGRENLTQAAISSMPVPALSELSPVSSAVATALLESPELANVGLSLGADELRPADDWRFEEQRASVDARVALAYELNLQQYAAVLSTFPLLDRVQPRISPEPKSFVTRDLALLAYCELTEQEPPDVDDLLRSIGVEIPISDEFRHLDQRVARYRELEAIPYRPTPKGGRPPEDPELAAEVLASLNGDGVTVAELAETIDEEQRLVKKVLDRLVNAGDAFASGRGKSRSYYVEEVS
jgi:N-6 DNA Methylase